MDFVMPLRTLYTHTQRAARSKVISQQPQTGDAQRNLHFTIHKTKKEKKTANAMVNQQIVITTRMRHSCERESCEKVRGRAHCRHRSIPIDCFI